MRGFHAQQTVRATALVLVLVIGMTLAARVPCAAQLCQVPLFVMQNAVSANVMILADNSGSMNEPIWHAAYDPDITYEGRFTSDSMYYINADGQRSPRSFNSAWESEPSVFLITSDNGQRGRYRGNYLNWIYYNATLEQLAAIPEVTRIQVAKLVLCNLVDSFPHLRFGLTVFDYDDGGQVLSPCGSESAAIKSQINSITANCWTPLGETVETVLDYFSTEGPGAPIVAPCQYNFLIVMCDGLPTMDVDVSYYLVDADGDGNDPGSCTSIGAPYTDNYHCSDHMDDIAYYMAHHDLRSDMEDEQIVSTYAIGFNSDAPLLQDTATNGDGLYFTAHDAVELSASLEWVLHDIVQRVSSGSAVAVVSTERGYENSLYRGKFMPVSWHGYLESFTLPYHDGDSPAWEAGALLASRHPDDRVIFTALGTDLHDFNENRADLLWQAMEASHVEEAALLIDWGRGHAVDGYRDRDGWPLGDIVHSTPVVVGAPNQFWAEESYMEYYTNYADRQRMVYVGANDGMLHAFAAETGHEEWAFVPEFALPRFQALADSAYCHIYSCDQTVTVADVKIGLAWRTLLVGGGGEGGAGYFCIDVTEPHSPMLYWQITMPDGVAHASEPTFVRINGQSIVLIGSGLDAVSGDAYLHAYDLASGSHLGSIHLSHSAGTRNKATRPVAVDLEFDGETDVIYVADLLGTVWRIDPAHSSNPDYWNVSNFFAGDQQITNPPTVAYGADGRLNVYFGTGAYLDESDLSTINSNSFYCVYDWQDSATYTRGDLRDQTNTVGDIGDHDGWYLDLWHDSAERVTQPAVVVAQTVLFTSFAPSSDACSSGGQSWLYRLDFQTGGLPQSEDGEPGGPEERDQALGDGVASQPVIDLASETVVIQSSDASIIIEDLQVEFFHLSVRSWQENYDFVLEPPAPGI